MSTKAKCLNLVHHPESPVRMYLDAELNSTYIRIPIRHLFRGDRRWSMEAVDQLSAAMPREIAVVSTESGVDIVPEAFKDWWNTADHILDAGIFLANQISVYGKEYAQSPWIKCKPRCYSDPCPIHSHESAVTYIREKLVASGRDVPTDKVYVEWRDAAVQSLKIRDGYINAYSFSRKPVEDPDIALALAYNMFFGIEDDPYGIDRKYGLTHL